MAEQDNTKPGLQLQFGHLHVTATIALLGSVIAGFYSGVEWITHMQEVTGHNTEKISDMLHRFDDIQRKIDALTDTIATQGEKNAQSDEVLRERIFGVQQSIADMLHSYQRVGSLEDRYDKVFAIYQPQLKRRR